MKKSIFLTLFIFLCSVFSQTTGVIRGIVTDESGEPLPGASIVIEGTSLGGESDSDGYYFIIGVRAGTYTVSAEFIGFAPRTAQNVRVRVGMTTVQNFTMSHDVIELAEIGVEVAMENRVQLDVSTSVRVVDMDNVSRLAVTRVDDVIRQTAGVQTGADGELHFRGGRSGEVNYLIDGISVGDPTGIRSNPLEINFANIESFNIQKGVPDAEYGDALSGSVNIVLRSGDTDRTGGHIGYSTDSFFGNSRLNYDGGEFSLSGPLPFRIGEFRPTYYIATDISMQNGYSRSYRLGGDPDSEYFRFADHDLTGTGFEMPQRRENIFNMIFRTAWDMSHTKRLGASYIRSRTNSYEFDYRYRYSPQTVSRETGDVTVFSLNWRHALSRRSYYEIVLSYYNRKLEHLPGGKRPEDFVMAKDLDRFTSAHDIILNGIRDGGDAEGYIDINMNGYFDREFFIVNESVPGFRGNYRPGIDVWEPFNPVFDHNMNGVYDGDYLYDSNGNNKWDYWEYGLSFSGFYDDVFFNHPDFHIVEGYVDGNMNGHYDDPFLYVSSQDEPFTDGDVFNDTGEPFVDQRRFALEGGRIVEIANGRRDEGAVVTLVIRGEEDGVMIDYTETYEGFWARIDHIQSCIFYNAGVTANADSSVLTIVYPAEFFLDLRTSHGSLSQPNPRLNYIYDGPNGRFDEYEAFTSWRPLGETGSEENLGWTPGRSPSDITAFVEFTGSYVIYRAPSEMYDNVPNWREIPYDPVYSTWIDTNRNGFFDYPNGVYDEGEYFADFNNNGRRDLDDGFVIPGRYTEGMRYDLFDNKVYKIRGVYTNQVSRYHLIKTGIEFTYNDLDYYRMYDPYFYWNAYYYGYLENDPYPDRGSRKSQYNYKPKEVAAFIQDKMEFEDLTVNAGVRLDMRILDDNALDYYRERSQADYPERFGYEDDPSKYTAAISPRLGISHAISESSKLFFSYGHLYQFPNYTLLFDPDTKIGTGRESDLIFGNMALGFERNIQYELGVVTEAGDYIFDVTGYFKDIYDMINTKTYDYGVVRKTVWSNSDYGKSRGIEFSVDRKLRNKYLWGMSYTLSYAYGKSSSLTSNLEEQYYQVSEFPLDWDERHALNGYFSFVFGPGQHLFNIAGTDDWTLSFNSEFGSGKPFTPTSDYFGGKVVSSDIVTNSRRMPYTFNTDFKLSKTFRFSTERSDAGRLRAELNIYNIFDRINVIRVYPDSGRWDRRGSGFYAREYNEDFVEIWKDPSNIRERRHYRFGISYHW